MKKYIEKQRVSSWSIFLVVGLILMSVSAITWYQGSSVWSLLGFFSVAFLGMAALFSIVSVVTVIDDEGIHYRFHPFQFRFRHIAWNRIKEIKLRRNKKKFLAENLDVKNGFDGWVYTLDASKGIVVRLKNGSKVLLGTKREKELLNRLKVEGVNVKAS